MKIKDILLATLVTMIWGLNFVVVDFGLNSFPPILFSGLRFLSAAFPVILFVDRKGTQWKWILLLGITLGILLSTLQFIGMSMGMPAGLSSLVIQIQALFTIILTSLFLNDRPSLRQVGGVIVALSGMGLLAYERYQTTSFAGMLFVILAGFSWAVSNIFMKLSGRIDMFRLIVWMSIIPPLPLLLLSFILEDNQIQILRNISYEELGAVFFTGLLSTTVAFAIWGNLFKKYSPNLVAPFSLLVPVFGLFFSFAMLGERLSKIGLISSFLVFTGLLSIIIRPQVSESP